MRRKKLANKIVSILMAGLMVASTPMSALATDVELTDGIQQIEAQSASEDGEIPVEDDADLEEESTVEEEADEDIIAEEEVTADEQELSEESGEEVILGDSEEADEVATHADEGETAVGGTAAADAEISVSISVKGEFAKAKDGSVMIQKKVTVTDTNKDGKLSVDEALAATHDAFYEGGAASGYASGPSQYGTSLEKLWGDTSKAFGYWDNDQSCMSLDDEVKKDDNLVAYVYKDTTGYSDAYSKFTSKEYTTEAGSPLTVGVEKAGYDENYKVA